MDDPSAAVPPFITRLCMAIRHARCYIIWVLVRGVWKSIQLVILLKEAVEQVWRLVTMQKRASSIQ